MTKGSPNISELPKSTSLVLGIDMGQTCHIVVGLPDGVTILRMEAVPAERIEERVKYYYDNYKIVAGAVDRLPYTPTSEAIMRLTKNRVVPMAYVTGKDSDMKIVLDEYEHLSHFNMNRTKILDAVATSFRDYEIALSGYGHQKSAIIEHYRNMVRQELPEKPAVWEKLSGSSTMDHYFHATALYKGALMIRPLIAEFLSQGVGEMFSFGSLTLQNVPAGLPGSSGVKDMGFGFGEKRII
jgi:hypothetical protein